MKIKPSNDKNVVDQWISQQGDYTYRVKYNLNTTSIVVDVGARHGNWSNLIRSAYNPKIYCFEVVPEFCNQLIQNGYKTFCVAVSDKKEKIKLGIFESEASMFYTESAFECDAIPASEIFNLINQTHIDLLKINVEGAEYKILDELISSKNITKISNIQVQFHLFDTTDNNYYEPLAKKLSETHVLSWRFPFVWENWVLKN